MKSIVSLLQNASDFNEPAGFDAIMNQLWNFQDPPRFRQGQSPKSFFLQLGTGKGPFSLKPDNCVYYNVLIISGELTGRYPFIDVLMEEPVEIVERLFTIDGITSEFQHNIVRKIFFDSFIVPVVEMFQVFLKLRTVHFCLPIRYQAGKEYSVTLMGCTSMLPSNLSRVVVLMSTSRSLPG